MSFTQPACPPIHEKACIVPFCYRPDLSLRTPLGMREQLQDTLAITGLPVIDFLCFIPPHPSLRIEGKRNDTYIQKLLAAEKVFWQRLKDRGSILEVTTMRSPMDSLFARSSSSHRAGAFLGALRTHSGSLAADVAGPSYSFT